MPAAGGEVDPPLVGGLKGLEGRKEEQFGGLEQRGSGGRQVLTIRRKEGHLPADLVGRRIISFGLICDYLDIFFSYFGDVLVMFG